MEVFEPRSRLPEEWAKRAACPVCQAIGLEVNRTTGSPDRMVCKVCRVSFEIAQDFTHIRLTRLPQNQITQRIDLIGQWLTPIELRAIVDQPLTAHRFTEPMKRPFEKSPGLESKSILASLPKLTQDEVNKRAINLNALGNTPETVRLALERAGATPDQISRGLEAVIQLSQKKFASQKTGLYVIAMLAFLSLLAFAAWSIFGSAAIH